MMQDFDIKGNTLYKYIGNGGEIIIPEGVMTIVSNAFKDIKNIECIVLPKSIMSIERCAFSRCEHIGKVVITGNPKIADRAFADTGVGEYFVEDSTKYISEDGVVFNAKKTKMVLYPAHKNIAEYKIPEGVTGVAPYVLNGTNIYVFIVYLPKSLHKIPKNAFSFHGNDRPEKEEHEKIKKYVQWAWLPEINERVCWIDGHVAFYNPELINELGGGIYLGGPIDDLPDKYRRYAAHGFLYALQVGIKEIEPYKTGYFEYIKKNENNFISVVDDFTFNLMLREKLISSKAAAELINHPYVKATPGVMAAVLDYQRMISEESGLSGLALSQDNAEMKRRIYMEKRREEIKNHRGIKGITFVATGDMKNFGWQDEYTGAKDWSDLQEFIEKRGGFLRSAVSSKTDYLICNDTTADSEKLRKAMELGVTILTEEEFLKMAKMSNIKTDTSDFEIVGKTLKKYKGKGKRVVLPETINKISYFGHDNAVEEVVFPEGITEICDAAFTFCSTLKKIKMPNSLKKIGEDAFWGCENLEEISIPSSVEVIQNRAFCNCNSLKRIRISDTIKKLSRSAFMPGYFEPGKKEDLFFKDWEITVDCISNDEQIHKQIIYALHYETIAYAFLRNKLNAGETFVAQIKKWLSSKNNRKIITDASIRHNEAIVFKNLLQLDVKISPKELNEYMKRASDNNCSEIVAELLSSRIRT